MQSATVDPTLVAAPPATPSAVPLNITPAAKVALIGGLCTGSWAIFVAVAYAVAKLF